MDNRLGRSIGAAILTGFCSVTSATSVANNLASERAQSESAPSGETATFDFSSSPCSGQHSLSAIEFSAFEEWQGALAVAAELTKIPAYGVSMLLSQSTATDGAVEQAAEEIADNSEAQSDPRAQRQRLFALGLAVLLNLSGSR